jgi:hypothetical protein
MTEKRTKTNDAKIVVSREFTIDDSVCGVITACRNGKGNVLSVLIPGFERLEQPLQKGDSTVIEIKKGESIRVKMTVTHSDDNKGPQDCYRVKIGRESITVPFLDKKGAAAVVAVTFNRGEIVFDASSSVGDEYITRYHSQMTGRQCKISVVG